MNCRGFLLIAFLSVWGYSYAKDYKVKSYSHSVYGEYTLYDFKAQDYPVFPDGVKPIYHIYIGRHGSRYIEYANMYTRLAVLFAAAQKQGILTSKGKQFWIWFQKVYPSWKGHETQLTDKGRWQMATIAESVYNWIPQLFEGQTVARVSTSPVLRVVHSGEAFLGKLEQLDKDFKYSVDTIDFMKPRSYAPVLNKHKEIFFPERDKRLNTKKSVSVFLTDPSWVKKFSMSEYDFTFYMRNLLAGITSLDGEVPSGYEKIVSRRWHKRFLDVINISTYYGLGRCPQIGGEGLNTYKDVWRYIMKTAQEDLNGQKDVALNLNFTHDVVILNLLAQLGAGQFGIEVRDLSKLSHVWSCSNIPLACNLQFCVCKRQGDSKLLIYPLLSGRPISLPLKEVLPGAYYWEDLVRLNP